jgi:hypothetical protein
MAGFSSDNTHRLTSKNEAAPVSHQKQPDRNATNAIETKQSLRKINEADRCSAAHNGLVAGASPAGPANFAKTEITPDFIRLFKGLISEMPVWQPKIGRENLRVFSTGQNSTPIGLEPFRNECRVLDFLGRIIDLL